MSTTCDKTMCLTSGPYGSWIAIYLTVYQSNLMGDSDIFKSWPQKTPRRFAEIFTLDLDVSQSSGGGGMIDKSVRAGGRAQVVPGAFCATLVFRFIAPPPCFVLCCLAGLVTHQSVGAVYPLPISLLICLWTFLSYSYLVTMISIKILRAP